MEYVITAEAVAIAINKGWYADTFKELTGKTLEIDIAKETTYILNDIECILLDTALIEGIDNIGELYMPVDALEAPKTNKYEMTFLEQIEEDKKKREFKKMLKGKVK